MISMGCVTSELVRRPVPLSRVMNLAGAALLAGATAHATPTPTTSARDQAVVHFNEGNEAFTRGDTHEAYRQYLTAWELHRTFDIACNLGRAEAELGKLPQAASHLAYCLDHFSSSPQQDLRDARQRYSALFDTVRTQVSSLRFEVEPAGAEVFVNGANVGTTPLDHDIFVMPGTQVVELRRSGYRDLRRELPAFAGESRSLALELEPLEAAPATATPLGQEAGSDQAPAAPPASSVDSRSIALVSGAVLTAAGAGVGLGFYFQGAKLDDEASVLRERLQADSTTDPNPCAMTSNSGCAQLAQTVDRRDQAWTISTIGFVSAGVFGLGTLATWLWWPATPASATTAYAPTITPVLTGHELGATISGTL